MLEDSGSHSRFKPVSGGSSKQDISRNRVQHAEKLARESDAAVMLETHVSEETGRDGIYLTFCGDSTQGLDLSKLGNDTQHIALLNAMEDDNGEWRATVHVPSKHADYYAQQIQKYATVDTESGKPCLKDKIEPIKSIKSPSFEDFWTGSLEKMPGNEDIWVECWLDTEYVKDRDNIVKQFRESCLPLCIEVREEYQEFLDRTILLIRANRVKLEQLIRSNGTLAEIRPPATPNEYFRRDMSISEGLAWGEDLRRRIDKKQTNATVCLLDTGINDDHPLLKDFVAENGIGSYSDAWGTSDVQGHGTQMAGIALFDDLKDAIETTNSILVDHEIESEKVKGPTPNDPELYGLITQAAIAEAEIRNPQKERVFCMAVTAPADCGGDGTPTSWSAAVDEECFAFDGDDSDKRLMLISAGNIVPEDVDEQSFPEANYAFSIEDPGQAWNAITVGAFASTAGTVFVGQTPFHSVAEIGDIAPCSRTSASWSSTWPVKPEICCEGGNYVTNGIDVDTHENLQRLTLSHTPDIKLFDVIGDTSAATAQASFMAARIAATYPELWPETIRGLIVHSARWTKQMIARLESQNKTGYKQLLRLFGYGVPNLDRAMETMPNRVNMVIQGKLVPFNKDGGLNEMVLHELPWPNEVLEELGDKEVTVRVTLSYFIEPYPGRRAFKNKYAYQSHALKFEMIGRGQTPDAFVQKINASSEVRGEDYLKDSTSLSADWVLGKIARDGGSIHSDYKILSAADLIGAGYIAVFPAGGWWARRKKLNRTEKPVRYSLVVSLETEATEVDLLTEIVAKIKTPITTEIDVAC